MPLATPAVIGGAIAAIAVGTVLVLGAISCAGFGLLVSLIDGGDGSAGARSAEPTTRPTNQNKFAPYDIEWGQGIYHINAQLGGPPDFTVPSENGYLGRPALNAYYSPPEGKLWVMYASGSAVTIMWISEEVYEIHRKKARE